MVERCFECRRLVQKPDVVYGPLCGPTDDEHRDCSRFAWHPGCRSEWLADLQHWSEVVRYDPSDQLYEPDTTAP